MLLKEFSLGAVLPSQLFGKQDEQCVYVAIASRSFGASVRRDERSQRASWHGSHLISYVGFRYRESKADEVGFHNVECLPKLERKFRVIEQNKTN